MLEEQKICLTVGHFNHPAVRNATSVTVRQHNSLDLNLNTKFQQSDRKTKFFKLQGKDNPHAEKVCKRHTTVP